MYDFDQINSGKIIKNVNVCFNILVLHLILMMRRRKIKVMMKSRNKLLTPRTPRQSMKWKTPSHLHLHSATGLQHHHLYPLQKTNTKQKDALWS